MLAFSNDYYGMIFRATQSVELFCAYPTPENFSEIESQEPTQTEVDRSHYFEGLTEAAIVYNPTGNNYMIYNKKLILREALRKEVVSLLLL